MIRSRLHYRRRGVSMFEAIVAVTIAAAVLASLVQVLALAYRQNQTSMQHAMLVREAGNLMETLLAKPWGNPAPDNEQTFELSAACRDELPEATVQVKVTEQEGGQSQRISIRIELVRAQRIKETSVSLVGWKFRDGEDLP